VLALTYYHTSIFLSNHSVYLQNSATGVSVCLSLYLPVKFSAAANVLTLSFMANNSEHVCAFEGEKFILCMKKKIIS